jgi:putative FmdB family regulatory protein
MPVFEYKCRQCGHQFEYLVLHSSPAAECPACQKQDLEQLISLCAVSSEATRQANLSAAHARAAAVRNEKQRQQHTHLHDHFEDRPAVTGATDATGERS